MDAWRLIILTLTLMYGVMSQEDGVPSNAVTTEVPVKTCTTPRGVKGNCVQRQSCDFGPSAIDHSLYKPNGYTRPCAVEEVCCPLDSLVQPEATVSPMLNDEAFAFDDDD